MFPTPLLLFIGHIYIKLYQYRLQADYVDTHGIYDNIIHDRRRYAAN